MQMTLEDKETIIDSLTKETQILVGEKESLANQVVNQRVTVETYKQEADTCRSEVEDLRCKFLSLQSQEESSSLALGKLQSEMMGSKDEYKKMKYLVAEKDKFVEKVTRELEATK